MGAGDSHSSSRSACAEVSRCGVVLHPEGLHMLFFSQFQSVVVDYTHTALPEGPLEAEGGAFRAVDLLLNSAHLIEHELLVFRAHREKIVPCRT